MARADSRRPMSTTSGIGVLGSGTSRSHEMAPAALIDKQRIQWEAAGPLAARTRFTHIGNTVSALLSFNQAGELIDFISNDRLYSEDGKTFKSCPWSTPWRHYKDFDGRKVVGNGEAVWHTPEGEFTYGKFHLIEIEYNYARRKLLRRSGPGSKNLHNGRSQSYRARG